MRPRTLRLLGLILLLGGAAWGQTEEPARRHHPYLDPRGLDVQVLVDGHSLTEHGSESRRAVEVPRGAEYELRISNPLTVRVAVVLKVDGLNTIDATSTPAREARKWVIPARDSITIRGWQVSSRRARRFTFTDEGRSYASKLGRSGEFGTISATFFREREPVAYQSESDQERWAGSPLSAATGARGSDSVARSAAPLPHPANRAATGIGSSVAYTVRRISMDLESDPVARITLHYDFSHPWRHPDDRLSFSPEPPDDDPGPFCPEP